MKGIIQMNRVMKELKKRKVLIAFLLLMIYVVSKVEIREGFSRHEARGGFMCMIGGKNNELQCNTFEERGKNQKNFTCKKDQCKIKGGGKFMLPSLRDSGQDIMQAVMNGLGYST